MGQADDAVVYEALGIVFIYSEESGHDILHLLVIHITPAWS
jgi:hypothetical protein